MRTYTIPAYRRTGHSSNGFKDRTKLLSDLATVLSNDSGVLVGAINKIFGTPAEQAASSITQTFNDVISQSIHEGVFNGVLFEAAVYTQTESGTDKITIRLLRAGDNPHDALERHIYYDKLSGKTPQEGLTLGGRLYNNNKSFFVFVSRNEQTGTLQEEIIANPKMWYDSARASVISGPGLEEREITESFNRIEKYTNLASQYSGDHINPLARDRILSLTNARIEIEQKIMRARALLRRAKSEKAAAARLNQAAGVFNIAGKALNFVDGLENNPEPEPSLNPGEYSPEYGTRFQLDYQFDPSFDPTPALELEIQELQENAQKYDNILASY